MKLNNIAMQNYLMHNFVDQFRNHTEGYYGYIYKVINLYNKKVYIGQSTNFEYLKKYFGSGLLIKRAIKKYGILKKKF